MRLVRAAKPRQHMMFAPVKSGSESDAHVAFRWRFQYAALSEKPAPSDGYSGLRPVRRIVLLVTSLAKILTLFRPTLSKIYPDSLRGRKGACVGRVFGFGWRHDSRRVSFASPARAELLALLRDGHSEQRLARRANALLLLDDGWSCEKVAKALYLDDDTVR